MKAKITKRNLNYFKSLTLNVLETGGIIDFDKTGKFERAMIVPGLESYVEVPSDWEVTFHTHPWLWHEANELSINFFNFPSFGDILGTINQKKNDDVQTHLLFTSAGVYELKQTEKIQLSKEDTDKHFNNYEKKLGELWNNVPDNFRPYYIFKTDRPEIKDYMVESLDLGIEKLLNKITIESIKYVEDVIKNMIKNNVDGLEEAIAYLSEIQNLKDFSYYFLYNGYKNENTKKILNIQEKKGKEFCSWLNSQKLGVMCKYYNYENTIELDIKLNEPEKRKQNLIKIYSDHYREEIAPDHSMKKYIVE